MSTIAHRHPLAQASNVASIRDILKVHLNRCLITLSAADLFVSSMRAWQPLSCFSAVSWSCRHSCVRRVFSLFKASVIFCKLWISIVSSAVVSALAWSSSVASRSSFSWNHCEKNSSSKIINCSTACIWWSFTPFSSTSWQNIVYLGYQQWSNKDPKYYDLSWKV